MLSEEIVKAVEKVKPSIVNVSTVKMVYEFFFYAFPVHGVGSGIVVDEEGLFLTNHHVIRGSDRIQASFSDGLMTEGRVVGADPSLDIALIKVDDAGLKPAELGDSDTLRVGEIVIAVGNPLGLAGEPTVTMGVVSALDRQIVSRDLFFPELIQTDAAINPGNSGGPLVNLKGEVVAVNTAVIPFAQGISFAIPISSIKPLIESFKKYGRMVKPWLGVKSIDVNKQIANYYSLGVDYGALVVEVSPRSPAERAGLRPGDVVTMIDGKPVKSSASLVRELRRKSVGQRIELLIYRGYSRYVASPVLEEAGFQTLG
ncbi:MAG: trypsin-like peptidase domain-containing protein [Candidatus Brockarchaeota archaeon]|nr:trypsin-like peptidase domain-containing protein [Candidatus Brockarchaeota archaeon]